MYSVSYRSDRNRVPSEQANPTITTQPSQGKCNSISTVIKVPRWD